MLLCSKDILCTAQRLRYFLVELELDRKASFEKSILEEVI